MSIPAYLPYFVLSGTTAIVIAILYGVNRALVAADWPAPSRKRTVRTIAAVLIGWLLLSIWLAGAGAYHAGPTDLPTIQYGILIPILAGLALIWRSKSVARLLEAIPQQWLVGVQLYRALGVIFLILYATGYLPRLFAWPAGIGDIAVGLLAPIVAFAYARALQSAAGYVAAWNVFGIVDLIVAVGTGFVTSPSLLQPAATAVEPTSGLMTVLPMVLIPVYLVPLSIILHAASLATLHRERSEAERRGAVLLAS
jgi:hypothetical protein